MFKPRIHNSTKQLRLQKKVSKSKAMNSNAVAAGSLVNLATILYLNSIRGPAMISYFFCVIFGFQVLFGLLKVKKLDQKEKLITGTA
ncbi:hypothetical protein CTI12_AA156230 [Artemisia annua]|uniref:Uncharacterized protein n=1 Tax=Artemisia annua TaxID=35608 RepID=A0A2U1PGA0_ARTAN|nr:hypothetical protein CTI12_AA156230 [Artemisia annua]